MLLLGSAAQATEVLVAVAANFAEVLDQLAPEFTRQTGHQVQRTPRATPSSASSRRRRFGVRAGASR